MLLYILVTKMGTQLCSETSMRTMILCVIVLLTNSVGMDNIVNTNGMYTMSIGGILAGIFVSAYHESDVICGRHVITEHFGPNAMDLPTNHDHKQAEITKKMFITL